jgi:hypothetical protein
MVKYLFSRTTAEVSSSGNVKTTTTIGSMEREDIEIAKDWDSGQALYKQGTAHETTGFIGRGYTKQGIYVSHPKP